VHCLTQLLFLLFFCRPAAGCRGAVLQSVGPKKIIIIRIRIIIIITTTIILIITIIIIIPFQLQQRR